jgi:predicted nucleotidyltransferase component of viral defense system
MLGLSEIIKYYPEHMRGFKRFIIREYLQYKILQIVFDNQSYANKLCFLGGTCLRLVYENTRFSEDLDFDNFNLSPEDFEGISTIIAKDLKKEGYEVEIRNVLKGTFHCYIRFPELLYKEGLSGHKEEKILIQLDTEPQYFDFEPDRHILNKFDVFTEILTTPQDLLLAQKFYAILNRSRPKGRDFFDVVFLLGKAKPNYEYLKFKININSPEALKSAVLERCSKIDMADMAREVAPFLFDSKDEKRVRMFVEYLKQVDL